MDIRSVGRAAGGLSVAGIGSALDAFTAVPNQVLTGRVLHLANSIAIIEIAGRRLTADTQVPLRVGQELRLTVRDRTPDRIMLQVTDSGGQSVSLRPLESSDLRGLVWSLGLPPTQAREAAARALISTGQGITREAIESLLASIELAPDMDAGQLTGLVHQAAMLRARGLPVTPATLGMAALLSDPNAGLGGQLASSLGQAQAAMALLATLPRGPSTDQLQTMLTRLTSLLRQVLSAGIAERDTGAGPAATAPADAGDAEGSSARPETIPSAASSETKGSTGIDAAVRQEGPRLAGIRAAVAQQTVSLESRLLALDSSEPGAAGLERDLRALALQTRDAARALSQGANLPEASYQALTDLTIALDSTEALLSARQLANVSRSTDGQEQWLTMQLSTGSGSDGHSQDAELRISRDGRDGSVDPEHVRVVLRMELETLGLVEVSLLVRHGQVSTSLGSRQPAALDALRSGWPALSGALAGLGYGVAEPRFDSARSRSLAGRSQADPIRRLDAKV